MAEQLSGFGMRCLAYDPYLSRRRSRASEASSWSRSTSCCRQSDFVSMHALPHLDATHHLFGQAQFRAMKPTAYFVNTSRGATSSTRRR